MSWITIFATKHIDATLPNKELNVIIQNIEIKHVTEAKFVG